MENQNKYSNEEIFEKISILPVYWIAGFYTLIIYVMTFYPIYFSPKLYLFRFLPFEISALLFYVIIYFILFVFIAFSYRTKAKHMKMFSDIRVWGFYPSHITSRTSLSKEDLWGAIISAFFAILTIVFPTLLFLLPLFLIILFLFLFALFSSNNKPWTLKYGDD